MSGAVPPPEAIRLHDYFATHAPITFSDALPIMNGPTTIDALHSLDPELPCVFISGETGPYTWTTLLARGGMLVLEKPIRMARLREAIVIATGTDNVDATSVMN